VAVVMGFEFAVEFGVVEYGMELEHGYDFVEFVEFVVVKLAEFVVVKLAEFVAALELIAFVAAFEFVVEL
jgi:hypothetical protein